MSALSLDAAAADLQQVRIIATATVLLLCCTVLVLWAVGAPAAAPLTAAWAGLLLLLTMVRLPTVAAPTRRLVPLFLLTTATFAAADAIQLAGDAELLAAATATAGVALLGLLIVASIRARSHAGRGLAGDAMIFGVGVAAPILHFVTGPLTSTEDVLAAAQILGILTFGAAYIIGGGRWNAPAVLLAAGVIAHLLILCGVEIAGSAADGFTAVVPLHAPIFVAWTLVVASPSIDAMFDKRRSDDEFSLQTRAWMLAPVVALPVGVLAVTFVVGQRPPVALVAGSLLTMTALVSISAGWEARRGTPAWHVPVTISATLLVTGLAVVPLVMSIEAVRTANGDAARLRDAAVGVQTLETVDRAGARIDQAALDRQVQLVLGRAGLQADPRLSLTELRTSLDAATAQAERDAASRAQRARVWNVTILLGGVVAITLLLLRFGYAGRRSALAHLERHDALTGLPNRVAVEHRLEIGSRALVLLDLDDFRALNDVHGHAFGDAILLQIADRLERRLAGAGMLARVDGDAFAVVLHGRDGSQDAMRVASEMAAALEAPVEVGGEVVHLEGSIGVACAEDAARVADHGARVALADAELAMHAAKQASGTGIERFEPRMLAEARDRQELIDDLRRAIAADELHLAYQPIVDLATGATVGYEALARWNHPVRGALSPADFIPLAESSGLIVPLGGWALREACRQLRTWEGSPDWPSGRYVAVNVAGEQLSRQVLPGQVREALEGSGLPPRQLLVEVTESSLIESLETASEQLQHLRGLGVRFALDDFGTGYSSLSYLRRFEVDVVKIDRSFIEGVDDENGRLLVEGIIHLAAALRMRVVAEGVEDDAQSQVLRSLHCDLGQGFHFARPLPAADVPGRSIVDAKPAPVLDFSAAPQPATRRYRTAS